MDSTKLDTMIGGYWISATKAYEREWKIGEAYEVSTKQKQDDRRRNRRSTVSVSLDYVATITHSEQSLRSQIGVHRVKDFNTSPHAVSDLATRYRMGLCRTDDIVIPDYVSEDEKEQDGRLSIPNIPRRRRCTTTVGERLLYPDVAGFGGFGFGSVGGQRHLVDKRRGTSLAADLSRTLTLSVCRRARRG